VPDRAAVAAARYYERVRSAVSNIVRLLEACRSWRLPLAFVRTAAARPDGRDLSPQVRALGRIPVAGGPDAEILPELAPMPGDLVLNKPGSGVLPTETL